MQEGRKDKLGAGAMAHHIWHNIPSQNLAVKFPLGPLFQTNTRPSVPNEHSAASVLTHSPPSDRVIGQKTKRGAPSIDERVQSQPLIICPVIMKAQLCGLSANNSSSACDLTAKLSSALSCGQTPVFDNAASGAVPRRVGK